MIRWEAVGCHDPPYSEQEELAIMEAKKKDPPAADEVFPNLYLGNKGAAESVEYLVSRGITHVLNLAANTAGVTKVVRYSVDPDKETLQGLGIELKELQLRDKLDEDITKVFKESGRFIRRSLAAGGKVMVNCWQGASRSATVVLAFLLQHYDMDLETALKMIKSKRDIRPNNGFLRQLAELEYILNHGR